MVEMLRKCLDEDDVEAWARFWLLFDEVAAGPLRRLLVRHGYSEHDAEDVIMETSVKLFAADRRKLRSFAGDTIDQLAVWLVSVASNAARNWIRSRTFGDCKSEEIAAEPSSDAGFTPHDVSRLLHDLRDVGTSRDIQHLRMLAGLEPVPDGIPSRTLRHWKQSLLEKYGDFFRDLD